MSCLPSHLSVVGALSWKQQLLSRYLRVDGIPYGTEHLPSMQSVRMQYLRHLITASTIKQRLCARTYPPPWPPGSCTSGGCSRPDGGDLQPPVVAGRRLAGQRLGRRPPSHMGQRHRGAHEVKTAGDDDETAQRREGQWTWHCRPNCTRRLCDDLKSVKRETAKKVLTCNEFRSLRKPSSFSLWLSEGYISDFTTDRTLALMAHQSAEKLRHSHAAEVLFGF